ncbi:MAG TPA: Mu-like prophage major head subunit gpT family protein [Chloroflexota bacterium]|nr:Mu-like prophage major head subunit gpT family protein [Chloroflexota bacterium]
MVSAFPVPESEIEKLARFRESAVLSTKQLGRLFEDYSAAERRELAKQGKALPDTSFPIATLADLEKAIHLAGQAKNPKKARRFIIKRAHELGAADRIPPDWHESSAARSQESATSRDTSPSAAVAPGSREVPLREHVGQIDTRVVPAGPGQSQGHIVEVTLISSGRSQMGNLYPPDVLQRAVPLFEGAVAFADHRKRPDLPEGSVRDIVGYYRNVEAVSDPAGITRLKAQLHLLPGTDWLFNLLQETERQPNLCGLSIDAFGSLNESASSRDTKVVDALHRVNSVDIVTRPSAGGGVVRVLQSDTTERQTPVTEPTPVQESATPPAVPAASPAADPLNPAQLVEQLAAEREQAQRQLESVMRILRPETPAGDDKNGNVAQLVEELRRERDITRAEQVLATKLMESNLPDPVREKIRKRFSGRTFQESDLATMIEEERDTLAALTSAGQVTGMGFERAISVGMNEYEQLQAAFDKLFDIQESDAARSVPAFSGIREAFYVSTGVDIGQTGGADRPLRESFAQGLRSYVRSQGGRLQESEVLLREADVTTASFSYLLGTSMNKRLLKDYQAWPSEWQKFATITAIKDFKQQDRVRLGAFGSLSTVAEDAAYTTLTIADTRAIYTPTKRGNLVQVTRETIINDDLYAIKQIPQKLAVAAAFTLAEFVYNLLAPAGGNIYDGSPLFATTHNNSSVAQGSLGTTNSGAALSSAALQSAVIKMRKQTNMAGKPIGLKPRYLLVVPDLEFTAMTLLRSAGLPGGNNNDINPMMGYAEPIVSPQLNALAGGPTSTTMAIAVADPRVIDTLEVGFVGGQANPVLLIQDMPLYGLNFTQDTISYKVRHEYGGAVVDYRGFYLINN